VSIFSPIRVAQKRKFSTEETFNAVLDSTEEYMGDSDYQYSDFESESYTGTAKRGPEWDIHTQFCFAWYLRKLSLLLLNYN